MYVLLGVVRTVVFCTPKSERGCQLCDRKDTTYKKKRHQSSSLQGIQVGKHAFVEICKGMLRAFCVDAGNAQASYLALLYQFLVFYLFN